MPIVENSQAGEIEQPIDDAADVQEQTSDEESASVEQQPEKSTYARAEGEELLASFEKRVDSRIQSQVAKSENRTNQNIQKRLAGLEANRSVLNLSDEDYAKAQDAIIAEEQKAAFKPQGTQGKPTPESAGNDGDVQVQFMSSVESVFEKEGARLTPQELAALPEWQDPNGDPLDTLLAIKEATRQKALKQKSFKEKAKGRVTQGGGSATSKSDTYDPNKPASYYLQQAAKESNT